MNTFSNSPIKVSKSGILNLSHLAKPPGLLADGTPVNYVYFDENTGDVLVSENGGPLKKADLYTKAMITGKPLPYPEDYNPLPSKAVCAKFSRRFKHDAIVNDILDALFESEAATAKHLEHPSYQAVKKGIIRSLYGPNARNLLSKKQDNCDCWDFLIDNIIEYIEDVSRLNI